jgi:thioredoxin reductase (NADPH)
MDSGGRMDYDIAIIGCGPAGMSAAIYAGRSGMKTAVFEAKIYGGNMNLAHIVENYPGFEKTSGMELAEKMMSQVKKVGAEIIEEGVFEISKTDDTFDITTDRRSTHKAKAVILATGGEYKKLGIDGEEKYLGKGVSYCASCDGPLFKGKNVAVIGSGDHAVSGAAFLAGIAKNVYLVHSDKELKAEEIRIKQLQETGNVQIFPGYTATGITGDDVARKLKIEEIEGNATKELVVDGIFVSIGEIPLVTLARSLRVKIDDRGSVVVDKEMKTNVLGVFAAGDVTGGIRQIVTATGNGAVAAVNAIRYVQALKYKKE